MLVFYRVQGALDAAVRCGGPQLKRFVLLSSAVAVIDAFEDMSVEGRPYTEKDWNPVVSFPSLPSYCWNYNTIND